MSDTVVAALISAAFAAAASIVIQLIISGTKARETDAKMAAHEQKQEDGLEEIRREMAEVKRKLDIHNGYAEKIGSIQGDIKAINVKLSRK